MTVLDGEGCSVVISGSSSGSSSGSYESEKLGFEIGAILRELHVRL